MNKAVVMMNDLSEQGLRVGDPVKLKESGVDLRGDVWELRTGRYVVVRWRDDCRTTHSESALEYDASRSRADWSRQLAHEDRSETRRASD
ncbi:MAG TPA: hypothetical protein VHK24_10100 [Steroidobacter sp.]|jgi:hypothetical protein|nr:hypothetical protein [Steroidobacter sp.]